MSRRRGLIRARESNCELLRALSSQGKAILISSHILTELAEICTGAIFIERGRLLRAGTLEQILAEESAHRTLVIRPLDRVEELRRRLLETPHVDAVRLNEQRLEVDFVGGDEACARLLATLVKDDFPIIEFRQERAGLEEIFMNVTRGEVQ